MRISHAPAPGSAAIARRLYVYFRRLNSSQEARHGDASSSSGRASAPSARRDSLTLRDVAERAGVTESFLSQVERDVTSPSIATVQRIARALDLSIAQLFAEEPETGRVVRREARRQVAYPGLKSSTSS